MRYFISAVLLLLIGQSVHAEVSIIVNGQVYQPDQSGSVVAESNNATVRSYVHIEANTGGQTGEGIIETGEASLYVHMENAADGSSGPTSTFEIYTNDPENVTVEHEQEISSATQQESIPVVDETDDSFQGVESIRGDDGSSSGDKKDTDALIVQKQKKTIVSNFWGFMVKFFKSLFKWR